MLGNGRMSAWDKHRIYDRYIDALLSLSTDSASRQKSLSGILNFTASLEQSADFSRALTDPRLRKSQKGEAVASIAAHLGLDKTLKNTLLLLVRQGRSGDLPGFAARLTERLKKELGVVSAQVTAAQDLTPAQQAELKQSLGGDAELNVKIDPSLLGGLIVQIGSWRMDDSVKGKLDRLTRRLTKAA